MKPLAIDLFCGLGGWAEGFLAEGWRVKGFDVVRHDYGNGAYPGELVIQDVLTVHGSQFADAQIIVASPPCQEYSYRAMPWSRAKALPPPDNSLFNACFRIQREASETAGRYIPLIVENVRGAQKWVGKAKWHFGSYYLWGDVPALMPVTFTVKQIGRNFHFPEKFGIPSPSWHGAEHESAVQNALGLKTLEHLNIRDGHSHTRHLANAAEHIKQPGISGPRKNGKGDAWFQDGAAIFGSKSNSRKRAAAEIAKIPFPLARHIAQVFKPSCVEVA